MLFCFVTFHSYLGLYLFSTNTSFLFFLCPSRPGVLKDLKSMGSISLFIFFITLLVLARQVSPHYNSLNDIIICLVLLCFTSTLYSFVFYTSPSWFRVLYFGVFSPFWGWLYSHGLWSLWLLTIHWSVKDVDWIVKHSCSHIPPVEGPWSHCLFNS